MAAAEDIGPGSRVGRFVVEGQLGAGGMGIVYAARDRELDRRVALKVLRGSDHADDDQRLRLLREGQAMARVTHPNVITVHEAGMEGKLVFLAQELLDGGTLREWLEQKHPQRDILDRFMAAGRGLAAAHAAGLVHRDFKPDNVLLGRDGRVRVADFGLARALDAPAPVTTKRGGGTGVDPTEQTLQDVRMSPMSPMTRTGTVMGTPLYMAPEQHRGEAADARADQFSFCVALYQALYGTAPFAGRTAIALADAVLDGRIEPGPRGHRVPARLRRILLRGLATDPAARYPSMEALLDDLAHDPGRRVRRIALVAGVLALLAIALVGGWVLRERATAKARSGDGVSTPTLRTASAPVVGPREPTAAAAFDAANAAMRMADFRTAREKLSIVTQREPGFVQGHLDFARACEALGDVAAARASARRAIELAKPLPLEEQLVVMGRAHLILGERAEAREKLRRLFTLRPHDLDAALELVAVQGVDDQRTTLAALRALPEPLGSDPRIDEAAARTTLSRGNAEEAVMFATRAAETAKARDAVDVRVRALIVTGEALRALGNVGDAERVLDEAHALLRGKGDTVEAQRVMHLLAEVSLERGRLSRTFELSDTLGAIARKVGRDDDAAVAWARAATATALRGKLDDAVTRLGDAETLAATTPKATAALANAAATIALARGDATAAITHAVRCGVVAAAEPAQLAACVQIRADAHAEQGHWAQARKAYEEGVALARKAGDVGRMAALQLALAQLDVDEVSTGPGAAAELRRDPRLAAAAASVSDLLQEASARGAGTLVVHATVVLANIKVLQDEPREAFHLLEAITSASIEPMRVRLHHQLAFGTARVLESETEKGLAMIDGARAEADNAKLASLELEARLTRLHAQHDLHQTDATATPDPAEDIRALVVEANTRGFGRVARLAEARPQR